MSLEEQRLSDSEQDLVEQLATLAEGNENLGMALETAQKLM